MAGSSSLSNTWQHYRYVKPNEIGGHESVFLGQGITSGAVRLVERLYDKKLFACKQMFWTTKEIQQRISREHSILSLLKHPHIVTYEGIEESVDDQQVFLYMEYCDGRSLQDSINEIKTELEGSLGSRITYPEDAVWSIAGQISSALAYCHYGWGLEELTFLERGTIPEMKPNWKPVLHRDIKPSNIMLTNNQTTVKLIDFGFGFIIQDGKTPLSYVGTSECLAPEIDKKGVRKNDKWKTACDIYSLGCTLHALCALDFPKLNFGTGGEIVKVDITITGDHYSSSIIQLIKDCIQMKPEDRPDAISIFHRTMTHLHGPLSGDDNAAQHIEDDPIFGSSEANYPNNVSSGGSLQHVGNIVNPFTYNQISTRSQSRRMEDLFGAADAAEGRDFPSPPRKLPPILPPKGSPGEEQIYHSDQ